MKKKFTVHLDSILVVIFLFIASLGLNAFLLSQFNELSKENEKLQWKGVENSFNLSSQETYIKKIEKKLNETKVN